MTIDDVLTALRNVDDVLAKASVDAFDDKIDIDALQLCKMLDAQRAIQDAIDQLARSRITAGSRAMSRTAARAGRRWPL